MLFGKLVAIFIIVDYIKKKYFYITLFVQCTHMIVIFRTIICKIINYPFNLSCGCFQSGFIAPYLLLSAFVNDNAHIHLLQSLPHLLSFPLSNYAPLHCIVLPRGISHSPQSSSSHILYNWAYFNFLSDFIIPIRSQSDKGSLIHLKKSRS